VPGWRDQRYPELGATDGRPRVAILPVGALEAHGPHLPVGADLVIAEAMARAASERLEAEAVATSVLPALPFTPAPFADEFPGTLSWSAETTTAIVVDLARALERRDFACLALANAHFDPANLSALAAARDAIARRGRIAFAYPDLTRRRFAERLTEEFRSGACHAGSYETSILLAEAAELVDGEIRERLAPHPVSLVEAIRQGQRTFRAAGGSAAYFGDPARGSREEGIAIVRTLGEILAEAVHEALAEGGRNHAAGRE
jgi:creatinine amidohydrolase